MSKKSIKCHRGNALTEFVVIAGVLIPALLAMPMLGKLADAKHTTVQASRYAVWEKTVGGSQQKSDEQLSEEVSQRFLSASDAAIYSDGSEDAGVNTFWLPTGDESGTALLGAGKTLVTTSNLDVPGDMGTGEIADAIGKIGDFMEGPIKNAKWDVEKKGFYSVSLKTEVASNSLVKGEVDCEGVESDAVAGCLEVVGAIFTGEWDAHSRNQVESRVRTMVPAGALNDVMDVISYLGVIPLFKELKHLKNAFGAVEPDVLPSDRYGDQ